MASKAKLSDNEAAAKTKWELKENESPSQVKSDAHVGIKSRKDLDKLGGKAPSALDRVKDTSAYAKGIGATLSQQKQQPTPDEQYQLDEFEKHTLAVDMAKRNPLVPIGMLATCGALGLGLRAMVQGNQAMSQKMMRYRVGFQFFTVIAMMGGLLVATATVDHRLPSKKPAVIAKEF